MRHSHNCKNVITIKPWPTSGSSGTKPNLINQRKHGIRFEQAIEVFNDPLYLQILERIEKGEERWQTFGLIKGRLLLMVVHTIAEELEDGIAADTIRIISARDATPRERVRYENENS